MSELSDEAQTVLTDSETVVWRGKSDFKGTLVYTLAQSILVFAVGAFMFGMFWVMALLTLLMFVGVEATLLAVAFGVMSVAGVVYGLAKLKHKNSEFIVTNNRILQFDGILGRDFESLDRRDLKSVEVDTGIADKVSNTGTVSFETKTDSIDFYTIPNPYDVVGVVDE